MIVRKAVMKEKSTENAKLIARRKKQFFAFVFGVVIAFLPTVNVFAENIVFNEVDTLQDANNKQIKPAEKIKWKHAAAGLFTTGKLRVIYYDSNGDRLKINEDKQENSDSQQQFYS